jgi:hypothetical protein
MRKNMKKVIILLFASVLLAPTVSAFKMIPIFCVQKITYDPSITSDDRPGWTEGAWVGTVRIPTSPSGKYDLIQWADPLPEWYGPPAAISKKAEEDGVIFPGSIEIFREEWELFHPDTGEMLAWGYDEGYFDIDTGRWVVYGEVEGVLEGGELDFLDGCWIRQKGKVIYRNGGFHGTALWKFFEVD